MSYKSEISRAAPTLFVFLIDQSASMNGPFGFPADQKIGDAPVLTKADGAAKALNNILDELILSCTKGPDVMHFFDIAILGYGGSENRLVESVLGGALSELEVASINLIAEYPLEEKDFEEPVWVKPTAGYGTPMCSALERAKILIEEWLENERHRHSFPPVVINLTDGEATDGDPVEIAHKLTELRTSDGNVLLFNCHISSSEASPILFPETSEHLPDRNSKILFEMSSLIPRKLRENAKDDSLSERSRGMVFQAGEKDVLRLLEIGTRVTARAS